MPAQPRPASPPPDPGRPQTLLARPGRSTPRARADTGARRPARVLLALLAVTALAAACGPVAS